MKIRVGDGVTKLTADNPDLQFAGKGLLFLFLRRLQYYNI
jgi:hypothetical protein